MVLSLQYDIGVMQGDLPRERQQRVCHLIIPVIKPSWAHYGGREPVWFTRQCFHPLLLCFDPVYGGRRCFSFFPHPLALVHATVLYNRSSTIVARLNQLTDLPDPIRLTNIYPPAGRLNPGGVDRCLCCIGSSLSTSSKASRRVSQSLHRQKKTG